MPNAKLKCKQCKTYQPRGGMVKAGNSWFCSYESATAFGLEKSRKASKRAAEAAKSAAEKEKKAKHRSDKEMIKTRAEWLREAQVAFNSYVRIRDKGSPCISCDKPDNGQHQRHASHYKSVGSNSALRFNLLNVHASCSVCNNFLSGNIGEYTPRLIAKIGQQRYDWLLTQNHIVKHSNEYLKRIKKIFRKKTRLYKRRFRTIEG